MNLFYALDLYCERTHPGLWAEPWNVLSNLAFLLAAWVLWRRQLPSEARREARRMAVLMVLVGWGSTLFHLSGEVWAQWTEIGAMALFMVLFLQRYLTHVVRANGGMVLFSIVGVLVLMRVIQSLGDVGLNGSEPYLAPWLVLILLCRWASRKAAESLPWLLTAALLFPIALTLRSLDRPLCGAWPAGLHFAWHILVAGVLYLCARGLAAGSHERSGRFQGLLTADTVLERRNGR